MGFTSDGFYGREAQPRGLYSRRPVNVKVSDVTYLRMIGRGWFYPSTVLDDFSRYILAWKLCTTMTVTDVSDTLALALRSSGLERIRICHRPLCLSKA